jgi:hypothetical protein
MGMESFMSDDSGVFGLTSEKGWVRTVCDHKFWIACPRGFPPGYDRKSWAAEVAQAWWDISDLKYEQSSVERLAAMLALIHEDGYASVPCHQIWVYLRDPTALPLPVHIGIWQMDGDRDERLLQLSGAGDPDVVRPPFVSPFVTDSLGEGICATRHKRREDGQLYAVLAFAFRSVELETDVQVMASTTDLSELRMATADIEDFVRGMTVYYNATPVS